MPAAARAIMDTASLWTVRATLTSLAYTYSTNFPVTPGAFQTTKNSVYTTTFVTELNPTGSALVYSTYLGGNKQDYSYGVAVNGVGNAYVTGYTVSIDFPTTPGAFQTDCNLDSYGNLVTPS